MNPAGMSGPDGADAWVSAGIGSAGADPALVEAHGGNRSTAWLAVEGFDLVGELAQHIGPPCFLRGCQFGADGERGIQDAEPLDGFGPGDCLVGLVYGSLDGRSQVRVVAGRPGGRAGALVVLPFPLGEGGHVERDEHADVGPPVAREDAFGDQRVLAQPVLEDCGGHVLARGGDNQLLLPAGDVEEPLIVEPPEVTGPKPAVLEGLAGGCLVPPVAAEDV